MKYRNLVKSIIFLAIFAMAVRISIDSDTWWHLKTGEIIVENSVIPQIDSFSYTRIGESWRGASVGWLMQSTLYLIYSNFSYAGLNIFTAFMVTLAFYILYRSMSGGIFLKGFILILAATTSAVFWAARPYLMTFVLSALTITILEDFRWKRKDRLWILPLIMIIWVNSHGGFIYGIIFWGIYGIAEGLIWLRDAPKYKQYLPNIFNKEWLIKGLKGRVGKLLLIGLLMILAICVNAAGPKMLNYPFETVSITALQDFIQEWQSPNFHSTQVQPFAWLIILLLGVFGLSKKKIALSDFLLLSIFLYMSLIAARNIAIFALLAAPIFSRYAAPLVKNLRISTNTQPKVNEKGSLKIINLVILILLSSIVILKTLSVIPHELNQVHAESVYPADAVNFLKDNPQEGRMFSTYNWGGYLIWNLPEHPVFVDGRTDLYGDEVLHQWIDIVSAKDGWEEQLLAWKIEFALLEPGMALADKLDQAGWQILFQDEQSIILRK